MSFELRGGYKSIVSYTEDYHCAKQDIGCQVFKIRKESKKVDEENLDNISLCAGYTFGIGRKVPCGAKK
jgi:hypothetical protein